MNVSVNKGKWEETKEKAKAEAHRKYTQAVNWAYNNQDKLKAAVPVVTAVVYGSTKIITNAQRNHNQKVKEEAKFLNVYDPSNGQYIRLRKPMSNQEKIQLDSLRANGYSVTRALDIMGLL